MEFVKLHNNLEQIEEVKHEYTFPLDIFQKQAMYAISKDENVLVCAKTGSGKTLVGEYQIFHSLGKGKRIFYTTPIKSLSNQKFNDLKKQFPKASVGIMTGDIKCNPYADIVIMTTEILRNVLYKKGTSTEHLGLTASISLENVDAVIFDECHYMNDKYRGKIWEETMILLPKEINMVLLSATLDHPEKIVKWLCEIKQKKFHLIETQHRVVPLTHYTLSNTKDMELITIMDSKEHLCEKSYKQWCESQRISNKYIHRINELIGVLEKKELLPALFFVFSRKQCEQYADKIESCLLSTSDVASVKHIISFHLHRYKELEISSQYHKIYNLLCRGIAFHHSGLLPILKEIVEILFSKSYIKLMFCTETFAVGLNMPTKTVIFSNYKKYDEDGLRLLKKEEYFQIAGRAGRRGIDDKGVVIYFPEHTAEDYNNIYKMMKGTYSNITSHMDFDYDMILKSIQASVDKNILEKIRNESYWYQEKCVEIKKYKIEYKKNEKEINLIDKTEPYWSETCKRYQLEKSIKTKEIQKQLDSIKNKQLGPKWNDMWKNIQKYSLLIKHQKYIMEQIEVLEKEDHISLSIKFLYEAGYITEITEQLTKDHLTLKGILATEVNEGHAIIMTEAYTTGIFHSLTGIELIGILSCFQEKKSTKSSTNFDVKSIMQIIDKCKDIEKKIGKVLETKSLDDYWNISTDMIEPIKDWVNGDELEVICRKYDMFEGNFMRALLKISNIVDEWLSMAVYCQHIEEIKKIESIRVTLLRDVGDSLYLHM